MGNYLQYSINVKGNELAEQLIAELSDLNFHGFEEREGELLAFVPEEEANLSVIGDTFKEYKVDFKVELIENQNWNAVWEANFQPVIVNDFCIIRADFHQPILNVQHDIIITPKMSFGTGHHATTYMMIEQMQKLDFVRKQVADFGTGTGILAILAEKLGADSITAIDYDDWCIENALENIGRNSCAKIEVVKANSFDATKSYQIILANINKNVILENFQNLFAGMAKGGVLLLSGLLKSDEHDVLSAIAQFKLAHVMTVERNNWISILLQQ